MTDQERAMVYKMFFGPYIDEWRDERGYIDNSTKTIADRLELPAFNVSSYIDTELRKHFARVAKENE